MQLNINIEPAEFEELLRVTEKPQSACAKIIARMEQRELDTLRPLPRCVLMDGFRGPIEDIVETAKAFSSELPITTNVLYKQMHRNGMLERYEFGKQLASLLAKGELVFR